MVYYEYIHVLYIFRLCLIYGIRIDECVHQTQAHTQFARICIADIGSALTITNDQKWVR